MEIKFHKYHGTGNDFIIIDLFKNESMVKIFDEQMVKTMCDRHFGIGGDGLILLLPSKEYDFKMVYFNSDGRTSSMCGNGGRCIVKYAHENNYISNTCHFDAIDGVHRADVQGDLVSLHMQNIQHIEKSNNHYIMDSGSPHYVIFKNDIADLDIIKEAHFIRYNVKYAQEGINVNFVERLGNTIHARTYERGVEDETLSCGTGAVACAISCHQKYDDLDEEVSLQTKGGELKVSFTYSEEGYYNIQLIGPAQWLFEGCYKY